MIIDTAYSTEPWINLIFGYNFNDVSTHGFSCPLDIKKIFVKLFSLIIFDKNIKVAESN